MKKTWVSYHFVMVLILAAFILLDIVINNGKSGSALNTHFTEIALYIGTFNVLIVMPCWLIILVFNRSEMDRKAFLKGLGLFLLFIALAAWPIVTVIGYTAY